MAIVLDASFTLALVLDDELTEAIAEQGERIAAEGAVVPQLWRSEVANSLLMAVRRKRIDPAEPEAIFTQLAAMSIVFDTADGSQVWTATYRLAERHRLTIYDATYLELAVRRSLPLASLDGDLAGAALDEGLIVLRG